MCNYVFCHFFNIWTVQTKPHKESIQCCYLTNMYHVRLLVLFYCYYYCYYYSGFFPLLFIYSFCTLYCCCLLFDLIKRLPFWPIFISHQAHKNIDKITEQGDTHHHRLQLISNYSWRVLQQFLFNLNIIQLTFPLHPLASPLSTSLKITF